LSSKFKPFDLQLFLKAERAVSELDLGSVLLSLFLFNLASKKEESWTFTRLFHLKPISSQWKKTLLLACPGFG